MIRPRSRDSIFYGDNGEAWVMVLTGRRTDLSSTRGYTWERRPKLDARGRGATGATGPTGPAEARTE
jgi:hypothetical protein